MEVSQCHNSTSHLTSECLLSEPWTHRAIKSLLLPHAFVMCDSHLSTFCCVCLCKDQRSACCLLSRREESRRRERRGPGKFHLPLEKYKHQDITRSATLRNVTTMKWWMNGCWASLPAQDSASLQGFVTICCFLHFINDLDFCYLIDHLKLYQFHIHTHTHIYIF